MTVLRRSLIFLALTLLTQVGGIVYLICLALASSVHGFRSRWIFLPLFLGLYLITTAFAVPPLARALGRAPLPCSESSSSPYTGEPQIVTLSHACLLNRHYVRIDIVERLREINNELAARRDTSVLTVLETGFPFLDGFPLLPHLSHHDGRKVDLAFLYSSRSMRLPFVGGTPSPIGFFVVEPPRAEDALPCANRWTPLRWSFWWIKPSDRDWILDEVRTAELVRLLAEQPDIERILLEPHLVARLNVADPKVRFQGCQAARHDDHIHVSFK